MTILYEDSQILVCYKEAGLPVQSARVGVKDLVSIVKNYLWERNGQREEPYLGVIHRLDQPVEGVLVFAKTPKAARELSAQVSDGRMKKIYHAVVREPAEKYNTKEGTLTDHLLTDKKTNSARVVPEGSKGAKQARLDYRSSPDPRADGQCGHAPVRRPEIRASRRDRPAGSLRSIAGAAPPGHR